MIQQSRFNIQQPGSSIVIRNTLQNSTSIEFDYAINNNSHDSDTVVLAVQGCFDSGEVDVLDTYSTLANAKRVIALSQTYDYFQLVSTLNFDNPKDCVDVTVLTSGPGPTYKGQAAPLIPLNGLGSPAGVVAAPIGTLYINLSGGAGTTLYVKESGTDSSGWAGK